MTRYIRRFEELTLADLPLVGGKNASLGELWRSLRPVGVKVPPGFAITAEAYWRVLDDAGLRAPLSDLMTGVDKNNSADLSRRATAARALIETADLPADLWAEVLAAYERLGREGADSVAVRSSATAEDLPGASFAGQQESFLHVSGPEALRAACRRCFASLFTERAIAYRIDQGFDHLRVALSIGVQRMVRSDLGSSGVMFTLDTETGFRDVVLLNAAFGLGENVVQGAVDPDEFYVFKPTLDTAPRPILRRRLGAKHLRMVYGDDPAGPGHAQPRRAHRGSRPLLPRRRRGARTSTRASSAAATSSPSRRTP